ncbi:MAG: ATP-binding protein [Turneriella sp.]
MNFFPKVWKYLGEIGAGGINDNRELKLLRLYNRSVVATIVVLFFVAADFLRHDLLYVACVNIAVATGMFFCLLLTGWRQFFAGRIFYLLLLHAAVLHHHFYFGFAAGFWIMHLVLLPGPIMLFPQRRMIVYFSLLAGMVLTVAAILIFSRHMPPLFTAMNAALGERFLAMNLVRAPIILAVISFIVFFENNRVESELARAAAKANEAAEAKALFLSNMSHELRTPMNAVKGFSEILLQIVDSVPDKAMRAQITEYLGQIRVSATNLTSVIDDILDFARIETNRIIIRSRDFDLISLCNNIMQTAQFHGHRNSGVETRIEFDENLPRLMRGDEARLSQVLLNFLSNALKFTHRGSVTFRVRYLAADAGKSHIAFEIEDTGIGIPDEQIPRLFESFSPVSRETAARYGGTGLGLAITRHLVEMQGGRISVTSTPGKGSLFSFSIWFDAPAEAPEAYEEKPRDLKSARILVAEDNEVNQMLISAILSGWNAEVDLVDNGLKAIGRVQKGNYDLILMDIQMPILDGIAAVDNIRTLPDTTKSQVPIIALTADVLSETRNRAFAAGVTDLLTKPIDQRQLFAAVYKALFAKEVLQKPKLGAQMP